MFGFGVIELLILGLLAVGAISGLIAVVAFIVFFAKSK